MDRLETMLAAQRDLQERVLGFRFAEMTLEQRVQYVKDTVLALSNELQAEVLGEIGWKSWATLRYINVEPYKGELVDCWHFLMNLMLAVDMTTDELYVRYLEKRGVNITRQENSYDGISTKCPVCGRAQDDVAVGCYTGEDNMLWCDVKKIRVDTGHAS